MAFSAAPSPKVPSGPQVLLLLLGFLMYASTLLNGYALDDEIVIVKNKYTQAGWAGISDLLTNDSFAGYAGEGQSVVEGGRYRPLSLVTYAVEVGVFGAGHPMVSHLLNALLFALTCLLLFRLLARLIPLETGKPIWSSVAFMAVALFAAHPIHTEAVANIKGRDEILALLFAVAFLLQALRWMSGAHLAALPLALLFALLAFFSKESTLPLLAVAPLLLWMVGGKPAIRKMLPPMGALALAAGVYLAARYSATADSSAGSPELLNDPYLRSSFAERIATSFLCLGKDLKLLLLPYPLTHDYYPFQITPTGFGNVWVLISLALYAGLIGVGIWGILRRRPLGWAAIWFLLFLLPVSNLVVNTGVFMAERFLYLPSVGIAVLLALGLHWVSGLMARLTSGPEYGAKAGMLAVLIFSLGLLTQLRNPAWKDNFTLFTTDVETSSNSARAQMTAGGAYLEAARTETNSARRTFLLDASLQHLNKALQLYPDYAAAWVLKGNAVMERTRDIATARACYNKALSLQEIPQARKNLAELDQKALSLYSPADGNALLEHTRQFPDDPDGWYHLGVHYQRINSISESRKSFEKALAIKPDHTSAMGELGIMLGQHYQDLAGSVKMLSQALGLPGGQQERFYSNLGIAYGMSRDYVNSERVLKEGLSRYPTSPMLHQTLAATYEMQGKLEEARKEMEFVK